MPEKQPQFYYSKLERIVEGKLSPGVEGHRNGVWGLRREHSHQALTLGESSPFAIPQLRVRGVKKTPGRRVGVASNIERGQA